MSNGQQYEATFRLANKLQNEDNDFQLCGSEKERERT